MSVFNTCNFLTSIIIREKWKLLQLFFYAWLNHNNIAQFTGSHAYINPVWKTREERARVLYWLAINMTVYLQLFKMKSFFVYWDRFGSIDHNRASKVSKFTKTNKQTKNRPIILFYAFVHVGNGLELTGHLGMLHYFLCVHTLFRVLCFLKVRCNAYHEHHKLIYFSKMLLFVYYTLMQWCAV